MKSVGLALFILVVALVSSSTTEELIEEAAANGTKEFLPIFVETLKELLREPPIKVYEASTDDVEEQWIEQKLDHFDETEERTWQMRYLVNDENLVAGGPIFIYVGGEWSISPGRIRSGHFYDMAKEHNAILYYTEHRFYGQSKPLSDITVDNLGYLHVKQALADLAYFIRYQRENNPMLTNSKVIMAGGSYAATMVVWFKKLYPELLNGGWASSAPLLAKLNFIEYKQVVGRALIDLGSQACYNRVQNGIAELEAMFANKRGAEVKAMLKICNNFNEQNDLDLWSLFGSISNIFSGIVQYQTGNDVPNMCNRIMSYDTDLLGLTNYIKQQGFSDSSCSDATYKSTLTYYMDSTYARGASRPWFYQTCNEYGWYQTSGSTNQPFGTKFPIAMYVALCNDIFGDGYTNSTLYANVAQTNADFGGLSPNVENVYMTHGELDPWSAMGHTAAHGATIIPKTSHCADFSSVSSNDSDEMRASKETLAELVRKWLAD